MDTLKQDISARIKELRGFLGMTPTQFAKETGVEPQTIRDYENGKSIPGGLFLHNLAKLGLNVEWLLIGNGWVDITTEELTKIKHIQALTRGINKINAVAAEYYSNSEKEIFNTDLFKANQTRKSYGDGDTIYIEHYLDVRAAAGNGQVTPTDQTIIQVAINASEWRNYVGLDHKHVKIITVHGDSMRPTFSHGDQVLVDTACHSFIDDGVYAIQQGDLLRVKRIKLSLDGSIEVKSDNLQGFSTDFYTTAEAADFIIYGRVIPFKFGRIEL